jgi:hypothetical protein
VLSEFSGELGAEEIHLIWDTESNPVQRETCENFLLRAGLETKSPHLGTTEVSVVEYENSAVDFQLTPDLSHSQFFLCGVCQPSSVFGWSGYPSCILLLLERAAQRMVLESAVKEDASFGVAGETFESMARCIGDSEIPALSFVLSPEGTVVDFRQGVGVEPWKSSVGSYEKLWGTEKTLEGLVLASSGGRPWDTGFIQSLRGLVSIVQSGADKVVYVAEAAEGLEVDLTTFWKSVSERKILDIHTALAMRLVSILGRRRPALVSTIPDFIASKVGLTSRSDIDKTVSSVRASERRTVTLVSHASGTLFRG